MCGKIWRDLFSILGSSNYFRSGIGDNVVSADREYTKRDVKWGDCIFDESPDVVLNHEN